jgi:hypothetical protein
MKYLLELPVINFNWLIDVPDTGRETIVGPILFVELVGILTDIIGFWEKSGSYTFSWSIKVTWLK